MPEREPNLDIFIEPSPRDVAALVAAIDQHVPAADNGTDYQKKHKLLPVTDNDMSYFSVQRGTYQNGMAPFDGAQIQFSRSRLDLGPEFEEHQAWDIWKKGTEFQIAREKLVAERGTLVSKDMIVSRLSLQKELFGEDKVSKQECIDMLGWLNKTTTLN